MTTIIHGFFPLSLAASYEHKAASPLYRACVYIRNAGPLRLGRDKASSHRWIQSKLTFPPAPSHARCILYCTSTVLEDIVVSLSPSRRRTDMYTRLVLRCVFALSERACALIEPEAQLCVQIHSDTGCSEITAPRSSIMGYSIGRILNGYFCVIIAHALIVKSSFAQLLLWEKSCAVEITNDNIEDADCYSFTSIICIRGNFCGTYYILTLIYQLISFPGLQAILWMRCSLMRMYYPRKPYFIMANSYKMFFIIQFVHNMIHHQELSESDHIDYFTTST